MGGSVRGRQGLWTVVVLLVLLLVVVDLLRPDSLILALFQEMAPGERTPLRRLLDRVAPGSGG